MAETQSKQRATVASSSPSPAVEPGAIVEAIDRGDRTQALAFLNSVADHSSQWGLPRPWLLATAQALQEQSWTDLSQPFLCREFLGESGAFLMAAPYTVRREGKVHTRLSAFYGRVIDHDRTPPLEDLVRKRFGSLGQPVACILPVECFASGGNLGGEEGEAFIVPDGWPFPESASGPALNNMSEQLRRFSDSGVRCIRRIFDADTSDLLLDACGDSERRLHLQCMEYQFHEAGHAAGLGLARKLREEALSTYWLRGVEEWRSDGVSFDIAIESLSEERAGRMIAANLCLRFGVDSHRHGGAERDQDVVCCQLLLDRLLKSGGLVIRGGRLALRECSWAGLVRTVEAHCADAMRLTREELRLQHSIGVQGCYSRVELHPASAAVFEGLVVEPCQGLYPSLK